jgi:hypothetical protein
MDPDAEHWKTGGLAAKWVMVEAVTPPAVVKAVVGRNAASCQSYLSVITNEARGGGGGL